MSELDAVERLAEKVKRAAPHLKPDEPDDLWITGKQARLVAAALRLAAADKHLDQLRCDQAGDVPVKSIDLRRAHGALSLAREAFDAALAGIAQETPSAPPPEGR